MRLTKFSQFLIIGSFGFMAMTVQAQSAATMATVNGVAIPQSRLDLMVKASGAQGQEDGPELRKSLRENLITEEILAQVGFNLPDQLFQIGSTIEIAEPAVAYWR